MFKKIACCISGGVDSSVAALLLKNKGFDVVGVFMRNWNIADETGYCSGNKEQEDAEFICKKLQIPFIETEFVKEYWTDVFCVMVEEYENGNTPNPDVLCNKKIKFGAFYNFMSSRLNADAFATGHYANSSFGNYLERYNPTEGAKLLKAKDPLKDQTLFLSQIPQRALQRCMFPLGNLTKASVKKIALDAGLEKIVKKKESTGICFIGDRKFRDFIQDYVSPKPGYFIDIETNQVLGRHSGIHHWTVGQRSRVHVPGSPVGYYIVSKDAVTQNIYVAPGTDHPRLYSKSLMTEVPNWIHAAPRQLEKEGTMLCDFRFQHLNPLVTCRITARATGKLHVELGESLRALTCGQYGVFYLEDECLGGAKICEVHQDLPISVQSLNERQDCV